MPSKQFPKEQKALGKLCVTIDDKLDKMYIHIVR